jgi:hypothetical protein
MLFAAFSVDAKNPKASRYDIECAGEGTQGTYLVKVWVYAKSAKFTSNELKYYAVHGVIFKGYAGKSGVCGSQRAMATPALEHERADYFDAFFNNDKAYNRYATEVNGSVERVKVGKEYKYGMIVSVNKDALRKDLESAGVLRGLSGGF